MRTFAIVLNEANLDIVERIERKYPDHYRITDTSFLVADDTIAEKVATTVGIKGDDRIENARGVVFKLNGAYSGYSSRSLWEWLTAAEEK